MYINFFNKVIYVVCLFSVVVNVYCKKCKIVNFLYGEVEVLIYFLID